MLSWVLTCRKGFGSCGACWPSKAPRGTKSFTPFRAVVQPHSRKLNDPVLLRTGYHICRDAAKMLGTFANYSVKIYSGLKPDFRSLWFRMSRLKCLPRRIKNRRLPSRRPYGSRGVPGSRRHAWRAASAQAVRARGHGAWMNSTQLPSGSSTMPITTPGRTSVRGRTIFCPAACTALSTSSRLWTVMVQ